ncbi:MAG TPA: hypothetical protein VH561_03180 [Micromonosporaceae bacterium]
MTDDPTRPLPADSTDVVSSRGPRVVDPTRTQPVDPWVGSAPVVPPTYGSIDVEPVVVFVDRPRRRRWPWVVGTLAALALICCVGALVIWTPISREYPAHLELGDSAAGFDRVRDPDIDRASTDLEVEMFRKYGVDDDVAAVLADHKASQRRLVLIAATKLILDPGKELDQAINGITDRPVRNITDYHRLGPILRCANTEDDQSQAVIVCAWADHGSIGLGIYYGSWTMDQAAAALRDLRDAVVRRG